MKCGSWQYKIIAFVGVLPTLFLAYLLNSQVVFAGTAAVDDIAITVSESCSFSDTTIDTTHSTSMMPGNYETDIGITNFTVFCNDNNGYSIYAIGYSNEEYGNTKLLATVGGVANSTYDIVTGTATSGATSNWAMKLIPVSGTYAPTIGSDTNGSYANYHVVPTDYTKVATFASVTDNSVGSKFQSTYAVYASPTQAAGTYTGKVKYVLVHPNDTDAPTHPYDTAANKIGYYPNAAGVADTMGDQSISASDTSAILWASNFQRSGYGFVGWSDAFDYVANVGSESNPNAHIYGPNETIDFTAGQFSSTNGGLSLYAVWVKSAGSLQSWSGCSNLGANKVTALTDTRDNQTYAVAKLADGNCWMIENLRLNNQYTTGTTNQAKAQGYGGVFAGLANAETANFSNSTTANSLYSTNGSGSTKTISGSNQAYRFPRYHNKNVTSAVSSMSSAGSNVYSYGNYYTWSAAKANTSDITTVSASNSALTSICPTGWVLPVGAQSTASRSFGALSVALGGPAGGATAETNTDPLGSLMSVRFRTYPNNLIFSGRFSGSSLGGRGEYGGYWTATTNNNTAAYDLYFSELSVYPGTNPIDKTRGYSIRCVSGI